LKQLPNINSESDCDIEAINLKREKSCGAIIKSSQNDELLILLIKHKNGNHWAFPKGHVENGETEVETALREIKEETNLSVRILSGFKQTVTYSPKAGIIKDVVYFAADYVSGIVKPQPEEIIDIRWVNIEDALNLITYQNDKNVLLAFKNFIA
jgi:bis(5'-nucleosidyl)-tetraphosphatase